MTKVLLVEDDEMNRDVMIRRLKYRGFTVVVAEDGATAVEMARSEKPALILMDMSLPVIDGWEATRRVRAFPETRDIPVIALTAHAMHGDRRKCLEAGCSDYDTKPANMDRLMGKMRALLGDAMPEG